jgi:hypothetical protein
LIAIGWLSIDGSPDDGTGKTPSGSVADATNWPTLQGEALLTTIRIKWYGYLLLQL